MSASLYYGPHLQRALTCLRAGYPENAVSWMRRDFGEADQCVCPDPASLREVGSPGHFHAIAFEDLAGSFGGGEGI